MWVGLTCDTLLPKFFTCGGNIFPIMKQYVNQYWCSKTKRLGDLDQWPSDLETVSQAELSTQLELNTPVPSSCKFRHSPICYSKVLHTSELPAEAEMPHNHSVSKACRHFPIFSFLCHHLQLPVLCTWCTTSTKHNQQSKYFIKSLSLICMTQQ